MGIEAGRVVIALVLITEPGTDVVATGVLEILEGFMSDSMLSVASSEGTRGCAFALSARIVTRRAERVSIMLYAKSGRGAIKYCEGEGANAQSSYTTSSHKVIVRPTLMSSHIAEIKSPKS